MLCIVVSCFACLEGERIVLRLKQALMCKVDPVLHVHEAQEARARNISRRSWCVKGASKVYT